MSLSRLYDHPEGSDGWPQDETGSRTVCDIQECSDFVEVHILHYPVLLAHLTISCISRQLTGKRGDVIIFHPFMVRTFHH